jgi:hypothetical protein
LGNGRKVCLSGAQQYGSVSLIHFAKDTCFFRPGQ